MTIWNKSTTASSSSSLNFMTGSGVAGSRINSIYQGSNNSDLAFYASATGTQTEYTRITSAGNVGIGTTAPVAKLDVAGAIRSQDVSNGSSSIDFSTGNYQYTSVSCGAMTLNNMKSGTSYTLAVQGTAGGTCSFTAWSGNGTGALTVKVGATSMLQTANKHVLFTFVTMGSYVYVGSADGY